MMMDSAAIKSTKLLSRNGRKSKMLPIFFGGSRELTVSAATPTRAIVKKATVGRGFRSISRLDARESRRTGGRSGFPKLTCAHSPFEPDALEHAVLHDGVDNTCAAR